MNIPTVYTDCPQAELLRLFRANPYRVLNTQCYDVDVLEKNSAPSISPVIARIRHNRRVIGNAQIGYIQVHLDRDGRVFWSDGWEKMRDMERAGFVTHKFYRECWGHTDYYIQAA